ncbi:FAD:protein FMN transferase [bacterium]|nr:FAD:protein FMN transferase [bacterium]
MDTYCTIKAVGSVETVKKAVEIAFERIEDIDSVFDVYSAGSPLSKFNNEKVELSNPEIISVLKAAQEVSRKSKGSFDVTVLPLIKLWGFHSDSFNVPDSHTIVHYLELVDYRGLKVEDSLVTKESGEIAIDLGGIAKGYAISEAVKALKANGIESALIDAGGDIYALGEIDNRFWKIGVQNPRGDDLIEILNIKNAAVVTSGDYERFFEVDGVRYHHILDPRTGYPSRSLISVTVLMKDPILADAWSTALFVMGPDEGMEIVESTSDMEAIMITPDLKLLYSSGIKENLTFER